MTEPAAVEEIFLAALDKATPGERAAFVGAACAGNPDRLGRVRELLAAHDQSRGPLDAAPVAGATTDLHPAVDGPETVIGPYKLLQRIGEGGMGTVHMAEQTHPVQRKVALKLIKPGMDSGQVIARFEVERQALALMDHPNIARVLDAGTTDRGLPYFVMELIKGVPITKYCDEQHLTCDERLGLFVQVCQAVQHAHQKGVIHRDLKPSNVMVTLYDGKPVPKVIDFGVAKATGQRLTDKTLFTAFGSVVGTLEYMSPEQAEVNQLDVDTRSDVYSLGVLLYELLTGTTPLERKRFKEVAFLEVLRLIREEEPPKPSTRLSTTEGLPTIAANRGLEPKRLSGLVRGELDWIVMKCLEKDRNRRYETASAFAADVERYLADEPVQACPPSAWYRFRKLARRNRRAVAGVVLLGVVLLAAVVGLTISNRLIARERAETAAERDRTKAANGQLKDNLQLALQALDEVYFRLTEDRLFRDPQQQKDDDALLKQALAFYERFAQQNSDDPEVQYAMSRAYCRAGNIHTELERHPLAKQAQGQALALAERLAADYPDDPKYRANLAYILNEFAAALNRAGDHPEAKKLLRRAFDLRQQLAAEYPGVLAYRQDLALAHNSMGWSLFLSRVPEEAAAHYREAIRIQTRVIAEGLNTPYARYQLARAHVNLGGALAERNDPEGVEPLRKAIPIYTELVANVEKDRNLPRGERVGPSRLRRDLAITHLALGRRLKAVGDPEAEKHLARSVAIQTELVADVPNVPRFRGELASVHLDLGDLLAAGRRPADAEEHYRQAMGYLTRLVADHLKGADYRARLAVCHMYLGNLRSDTGRRNDAAEHYRKAFTLIEEALRQKPDDAESGRFLSWNLATCPDPEFRDPGRAVHEGKRLIGIAPQAGIMWTTLGVAYYSAGDWKAAVKALEQAMQLKNGGDSADWIFLAMAHWKLGHAEEARRYYDRAVQRMPSHGWLQRSRDEAEKLLGSRDKKG